MTLFYCLKIPPQSFRSDVPFYALFNFFALWPSVVSCFFFFFLFSTVCLSSDFGDAHACRSDIF